MLRIGQESERLAVAVVTGGAGFLASHMCDRLINEGLKVISVDNFLTGHLRNLQHLVTHPNFTFIEHDITEPFQIDGPVDYIIHMASPASPKDYAKRPIETLKVGAFGTYQALNLAWLKHSVFLISSSSEVYGDPQINPQTEAYWGNVNPIGPRSVYDEAKRYAEALTMAYHREYGVDTKIARIFNTFGPRMRIDDGRALPNFMVQALRGDPLTIYGDGKQTRSFCYVDDLIEGLYCLLLSSENTPINLGNPDEISVLQFAREIIDITGSSSTVIFEMLPQDDPLIRRPDITRADRLLGWTPRISRQEGLRRTLPYFRDWIDLP